MRKIIALILVIISGLITLISLYNIKYGLLNTFKVFIIINIATIIWFLIERRIEENKYYYIETENNKINDRKIIYNYEEIKYYEEEKQIYEKKKLMTINELEIYKKLKTITNKNNELILQSQIALASIINKVENNYYANELFRIIDFGIFTSKGEVLCLIELNDSTHLQYNRRERDNKVKEILEMAQIPLITIWTNKENTIEYLNYKLQKYIT